MAKDYQDLLTRAERLLSNQLGAAVHLHLGKVFQSRFSLALRCQVTGQTTTSVIIKQTLPVPSLPNHKRNMLLSEQAAACTDQYGQQRARGNYAQMLCSRLS